MKNSSNSLPSPYPLLQNNEGMVYNYCIFTASQGLVVRGCFCYLFLKPYIFGTTFLGRQISNAIVKTYTK